MILGDSGRIFAAGQNTNPFGTLPITLGMVETTAPGIGGSDTIAVGSGSAVVMGGTGADSITTGSSTSFVFGDDGYITWVGSELNPEGLTWAGANADPTTIDLVASTDYADGGNDQITIGAGQAIVVGGAGDDTITGGSGTNVILGDSGRIFAAGHNTSPFGTLPITLGMVETTAPGVGGDDTIQTGSGSAIVMGGTGADTISTVLGGSVGTDNTNFVFGDDGYITWVGSELNPESLSWAGANADPTNIDLVASTDYADGGNDQITIGAGRAIVVGGQGSDTITGGSGTNVILGDSGRIFAAGEDTNRFGTLPITLGMVETSAPGIGGADTIQVGTGSAIVMGGTGADSITTGSSTSFVFGDDGYITWVGSELNPENLSWAGANADPTNIDLVASTDYADGGDDQIVIGSGQAIVVGGQGNDTITGGSGTNVILGDSGRIFAAGHNTNPFGTLPITLGMVETSAPGIGGNDTVSLGTGSAIVMGGTGADNITTGTSTSFVFGDDGYITWVGSELNPENLSWAGANADPTNIDLVASTDYADGGNDQIVIGSGQAIVVGGQGNDTITGGTGTNVILGDSGRIYAASSDANRFGTLPITLGMVETTAPGIGGNDTINVGTGSSVVMGGTGADTIQTGSGTNFVFGDDGYVTWVGSELNPENLVWAGADANPADIDLVASTDYADGGNDTITIGSGQSIVVGGQGDDSITGGSGTSVILGDSGRIYAASADTNRFGTLPITVGMVQTTAPGVGGNDTITTLDGNAIVMGGTGADTIQTGAGTNIVFGDDGYVTWVGTELNPDNLVWSGADSNPADIDLAASTSPSDGGNDTITVGAGDAIIFGGFGDDTITGGTASNIIFGDSGEIDAALTDTDRFGGLPITVAVVKSTAPTIGGNDTIFGAAGPDLIVGGIGSDGIAAFEGDNIVIGDNGELDFDTNTGALVTAMTTAPTAGGGNDVITSGSGRDVVLGGQGNDTIDAGEGDNVVFGDDGVATFDPAILVHMRSTETGDDGPALGGDDTITTGAGRDVIVGGNGSDTINAGEGDNVVFGDNAELNFSFPASVLLQADSLAPAFGGDDWITTGTGTGRDIIVGGFGIDHIVAGGGDNVIAGDSASMTFDTAGVLHFFTTIAPTIGGSDDITLTTGDNIVFGGAGSDTVTIADGSNIVFGDNGQVGWNADRSTGFLTATDPTAGGADTIVVHGSGNNWIVGGTGGDSITTGSGDDIVFGDFASFTGAVPTIPVVPYAPVPWSYTSIFTTVDPAIGSDDVIDAGDGRNIVVGGQGNDVIVTGSGADDIVGGSNVAGGHDGNDVISSGGGDDVVVGDNGSILPDGLLTSTLDRTLTSATIYSPVAVGDGTFVYLPNTSDDPAYDPLQALHRTVVLFDGGVTGAAGTFGNDVIATGDGNDLAFGQNGDDAIWSGTGDDYVEGGAGADLIYGGLGQDDLIGGSSDLFGYITPAQRSLDGVDTIFGDDGNAIAINDAGDTSAGGHDHNADVIAGDNARIVRLVSGTAYLQFNYDNYPGTDEHIVPSAVTLLDYSPYGDASYTTCNPLVPDWCVEVPGTGANIGAGDFLYGESGNDVIYGETGDDRIYGGAQDDSLYGNSGNDWISAGAGDDGVLGDDGLLLLSRNGVAEPLYGLAATTQVTLSTGDADSSDIVVTVNVTGHLTYTAIEQPFWVGGNDVIYGGLGDDFLHGGAGDDAMSGAEALPNYYYGTDGDPLKYLDVTLAQYYTAGDPLGFDWWSGLFRYFDPDHPFAKIMIDPAKSIDFLLNFISALAFDPADYPNGVQPVLDDGVDVLFGDAGNDWLVGGTNSDFLFGGWGNDILQADDNLDSTKVTTLDGQPVTYDGICSLATSYSSSTHAAQQLCGDLSWLQAQLSWWSPSSVSNQVDQIAIEVEHQIGAAWTADEAATLVRLLQRLKPDYDPLANDIVDPRGTGPSYADLAFGGGGWDIMIANTASDRLADWHDNINLFYYPWNGDPDGVAIQEPPAEDITRFLLDLTLALGADPTRPEVTPIDFSNWEGQRDWQGWMNWSGWSSTPGWFGWGPDWQQWNGWSDWFGWNDGEFHNGEPFGEIGLFADHGDGDFWWGGWSDGWAGPWPGFCGSGPWPLFGDSCDHHDWWNDSPWGFWHGGENPGIDTDGASDEVDGHHQGSLGLPVATTPSALPTVINGLPTIDENAEALLHRIVIRGQLTAAEGAALSSWNAEALADLVARGYVVKVGDVWVPTNQTWLTLHLADPPTITSISNPRPALAQSTVTLTGTGDPTDTITIWDDNLMLGTGAIVDASGHWTIAVNLLTVGDHNLFATQTVNQLPQAGTLTSARGNNFDADVYPDAPVITVVSTPGPTTSSTPVTFSGTGTPGYTVKLYDGSSFKGSVVISAAGMWSLTVNLGVGNHSVTATQTSTPVPGGLYTSGASLAAPVTVYSPPSAPSSISSDDGAVSAGATVHGHSVAGGNVEVYEGSTLMGTATANAGGSWTATLAILALGRHTLTARVQDPVSGFWSSSSSSFTVTVDPDAPSITFTSTPPATTTSTSVTVSGTGVAGYTLKLYDGSTLKATLVVGSGGTWSTSVSLTVGTHSLSATQTTSSFTSDNSAVATVTVYAPTSAPSSITTTSGTVTTGATVSGHSVALGNIEVYEGTTLVATATANGSGNWTASLPVLSLGTHTLTARVQDPSSGFWSPSSSSFVVTIKPDAPTITSVSTPGPTTTSTPVTITGTAVAGYTLKLYDGSTLLTSVVVGATGTWSLTVSLAVGSHSLNATQTTSTFTSAASAGAPVTVYAPPAAPSSITTIAGTVTLGATVSGRSVAFGAVSVYEGSTLVGSATANAERQLDVDAAGALARQPHADGEGPGSDLRLRQRGELVVHRDGQPGRTVDRLGLDARRGDADRIRHGHRDCGRGLHAEALRRCDAADLGRRRYGRHLVAERQPRGRQPLAQRHPDHVDVRERCERRRPGHRLRTAVGSVVDHDDRRHCHDRRHRLRPLRRVRARPGLRGLDARGHGEHERRRQLDGDALGARTRHAHADGEGPGSGVGLLERLELELLRHRQAGRAVDRLDLDARPDDDLDVGDRQRRRHERFDRQGVRGLDPPRHGRRRLRRRVVGVGHPHGRRSLSHGDADDRKLHERPERAGIRHRVLAAVCSVVDLE